MRAWRSELAVPGSNPRMIEKGLASTADVVFLDLEDAVADRSKDSARGLVAEYLETGEWGLKPRAFRMNPLDSPHFYRDLIEVIESTEETVELIVVPKVSRPEDVYVLDIFLAQLEVNHGYLEEIGLELQIETAEGLVNCERIAAASRRIQALTFGPGDFAASAGMPAAQIGMPDSWDARYPGHRWHYAMSRIVVAARAAGIRPIDGPYADFRDLDGLRRSCEIAKALGFDGKWCIHPAQIDVVNEVFSPTAEEIEWAKRVIEESARAAEAGAGSVAIDGRMIDGASIRMAERTLSSVVEDFLG